MSPTSRIPFDVKLPSRYQVSRVVGRGGSAVVLQARDLRLQREVAVKVFTRAASTPEVLIDQEREAQLLARSSHPNLVTIFDVGAERGVSGADQHLFLVMEYVDGPDLAQFLRLQTATTAQVVELGYALCSALQFVHRNGVLHCDIKPSNVLLRIGHDGELIPKLADFGIAAMLQGQVAQGEFTVGTAAYLSPEQVEGDPLQEPSDVYALGLVLLEAATGRVAFPGAVLESAFARLDRDPAIGDELKPELAEILRGMTHREPAERWGLTEARNAFRQLGGPLTGPIPLPVAIRTSDRGVEGDRPPAETTLPALAVRTIGPDAGMPALDRTVEMVVRTLGASAAFLMTVEEDAYVLQARHGITSAQAAELVGTHGLTSSARLRQRSDAVTVAPIVGSRQNRLGLLVVVRDRLSDQEDQLLADVAYLAGQVLELRSATRRALLSR